MRIATGAMPLTAGCEFGCRFERGVGVTSDPNRKVRLLNGFGLECDVPK